MKKNRSVINIIRNNKEATTLLSNFGYLSLLQIAGFLFPLITVPYLSRTLGADGLGKIYFASAVITWFNSVVTWGMDYTATRDVSRCRDDIHKVSRIFSNVFWTRLLLLFISFFVLLTLICIIPTFYHARHVLMVTFMTVLGHVMFPEWLFQGLERMKYVTILGVFSKLIFTILVFVLIKDPSDYIIQPLCISLGAITAGCISLYLILIKWNYRLYPPSAFGIVSTLRNSASVFINNFMPNLYNSMSSVLLGVFSGNVANGLLSAGSQLYSISNQFINVLSRTFFPFLARRIEKHKIYTRISLGISICLAVVMFLCSPIFIRVFYTPEFDDSVILSRIISLSLVFVAVSNIYGTNYLILQGYERQLKNITVSCSVLGMLISVPLIRYFGALGAAMTIAGVRGFLALVTFVYARMVTTKY